MKRLKLNGEHLMKSDVRRKDKELKKKKERLATTKKKRTTKELKEESPEVS